MAGPSLADLRGKLLALPKAELHLHLRGAIPPEQLTQLSKRHSTSTLLSKAPESIRALFEKCPNTAAFLGELDSEAIAVKSLFNYSSFKDFLAAYILVGQMLQTYEDYEQLLHGVCEQLCSQNIVYAEVTVTLATPLRLGLKLPELLKLLRSQREQSAGAVAWLFDPVRDFGPKACVELLQEVLRHDPECFSGINLAGSEDGHPPAQFEELFQLAGANGLHCIVHAGEFGPADNIRNSIEQLGAERIGHGVTAITDRGLLKSVADKNVPIEACITSNLLTGAIPSLDKHPALKFLREGIPITVGTDDPTFFQTNLAEELLRFYSLGATLDELQTVIENGFTHSFLPESEKKSYLEQLGSKEFASRGTSSSFS